MVYRNVAYLVNFGYDITVAIFLQDRIIIFFCFLFLDPQQYPEGSYEIGSVRPLVRPSVCPGIFFELYH